MNETKLIDLTPFIAPFQADWQEFSAQLGLETVRSESLYQLLYRAYTEPQRAYHTLQHIVECLDLFYKIEHELHDPVAVQMAIWFHDVIYDPKSSDNEQRSAEAMMKHCADFLDQQQLQKVNRWIIATQHHQASSDQDLNYLLDLDLAILGSSSQRFQQYEQQIQFEYAWVAQDIYQTKRQAVLKPFYDMQPLFQTAYFQEMYEHQAKVNLHRVISIGA